MLSLGRNEILLLIHSLFLIYIVAAMFAVDAWVVYRLVMRRPVLPACPLVSRRELPWGIWTVLLTIVSVGFVSQACSIGYAKLTGRIPARSAKPSAAAAAVKPKVEGSPRIDVAKAEAKPVDANSKKRAIAVSDAKSTAGGPSPAFTESMALGLVIYLFLLVLLPLILRATTPTPLRDLGLGFERWWVQAAVGVAALLSIAPIVYGVQIGMAKIWEYHAHPLQKMVMDEFSPGVAQLAILTAVIVAPLFEEIMFRGILQNWLVSVGSRRRPELKPVLAGSMAVDSIEGSMPTDSWASESGRWPAEIVEPTVPLPLSPAPDESRAIPRSALAGIVLTSLIFAAVHGAQWPAPFAIFILSLAIGIVYQRTGSLIAAICMHATFNGISTLALLGSLLVPQTTQRPKAQRVDPPVAVAELSTLNGSACIRHEKR